jgi:hypothetical protein
MELDKFVDPLPKDKSQLVVFHCGGVNCTLSPDSLKKAKLLVYTADAERPAGAPRRPRRRGVPAPKQIAYAPKQRAGSLPMAEFTTQAKSTPANVLILDGRNPDEAAQGVIKGLMLIPTKSSWWAWPSCPRANVSSRIS